LDASLPYLRIAEVVEKTLNHMQSVPASSLELILEVDARARYIASNIIREINI